MLFDNNSISIDGPTNLAVSDNYKNRFKSYGWNYILIDGHNNSQIYDALKKAQVSKTYSYFMQNKNRIWFSKQKWKGIFPWKPSWNRRNSIS